MRDFLIRLLFALAAVVAGLVAVSVPQAPPPDRDSTFAAARQQPPESAQYSTQARKPEAPSSGDAQTQDALTFAGRVVKEKGRVLLKDPVTKMNYQLGDPWKALPYVGKMVRVTGKLNLDSNEIHIDSIEPLPEMKQ